MNELTLELVRSVDEELMKLGVQLYARPFSCAIRFAEMNRVPISLDDKQLQEQIQGFYRELYPSGQFEIPAMCVGGVVFRDAVFLARVNVAYGLPSFDPLQQIQIDEQELKAYWGVIPDQVWRAFFSVCDLFDFAYGVSDLKGHVPKADELWVLAQSQIEALAYALSGQFHYEGLVHNICVLAEQVLKGGLAFLGFGDSALKTLGHDGGRAVREIVSLRPAHTDKDLVYVVDQLPHLVATRYEEPSLTRLQTAELFLSVEFIAGEVLRRVSDRRTAWDFESDERVPARCYPRPV